LLSKRLALLIAVSKRGDLVGRNVSFAYDPLCRRQLLVVLQEYEQHSGSKPLVTPDTSIGGIFDTLARDNTAHQSTETICDLDEANLDGNQREALLKKLSRQMGRGGSLYTMTL
jgi:hypothetical protein